jgi:hypothetical protein
LFNIYQLCLPAGRQVLLGALVMSGGLGAMPFGIRKWINNEYKNQFFNVFFIHHYIYKYVLNE